jgi:hypothetical protein
MRRAKCVDITPIAAILIAVFKENRFSTIATLRHVVRETGYRHPGQTRHDRKLSTNQN